MVMVVYGSKRLNKRVELWKEIKEIRNHCNKSWVIRGDLI